MNRETLIRGLIITFGLLIIILGLYNLFTDLKGVSDVVISGEVGDLDFGISDILIPVIVVFIGYIIFLLGSNWKNFFKRITNLLIAFALFFLTLFLITIPINSNAENIADSVQPSLDYLIAASIDDLIEEAIEIRDEETISLMISQEIISEIYAVSSLTNSQAEIMAQALGFESASDKEYLSQLVISLIYDEAQKSEPSLVNTPLPLSSIGEQALDYGVDLSILSTIDSSLLSNIFEINQDAYITVLDETNIEEKEIQIGEVSDEDLELIWSNLGFSDEVSIETKDSVINIVLSILYTELEKLNLEDTSIPLASISSQIPDEIASVLDYDIFSDNISIRVEEINELREDCKGDLSEFEEICEPILTTEYNNLMSNFDNLSQNKDGLELPFNVSSVIEPISTIEKLENYIEEKTDLSKTFFTLYLVFMGLSFVTYFAHFKVFRRELVPLHIPYYISKINLIQFVPTFIVLLIINLVITSGKLLDILPVILGPEMADTILPILPNLEIYKLMMLIIDENLRLASYYLIISIILYGTFYFILRRIIEKHNA